MIPASRSCAKSPAMDHRVGVLHAGHDPADSGRDDGVGAGAGSVLMRTRLEVGVKSRAASLGAGLLQRENFGVLPAVIGVESGADDLAATVDDDRAYTRIGRSEAHAFPRQFESALEKHLVRGMVCGHFTHLRLSCQ